MSKFFDLTGQRFGRLKVVQRVENDKYGQVQWLCQCDCGKQTIVITTRLTKGFTRSCGCYLKQVAKEMHTKHNLCRTRLYRIWRNMMDRCNNPKNNRYKYYGEKGVKVCQLWIVDFMNFYTWSISNGYQDNLSIDRINGNGNYEPSNCRWATPKEQANNRSNNKIREKDESTKN